MKKKYLILALYVQGKGKNIFKAQDVVNEDQLNNISDLIKGGYIQEIESDVEESENTQNDAPNEEVTENVEESENTENELPVLFILNDREIRSTKDTKKKEIVAKLKELKVEFNPLLDEQSLFDLLKEAIAQ